MKVSLICLLKRDARRNDKIRLKLHIILERINISLDVFTKQKMELWSAARSEIIICNRLNEHKIEYEHEHKLFYDGGHHIEPDFTIVLPDGKEIYWEHAGMLGFLSKEADVKFTAEGCITSPSTRSFPFRRWKKQLQPCTSAFR